MIDRRIEIMDLQEINDILGKIYTETVSEIRILFISAGCSFSKRTIANMYRDIAFRKVKNDNYKNIKYINIKGRECIFYSSSNNNNYAITIKKFNKKGEVSNNMTQQTFDFISNNPIPNLLSNVDRLNFGYSDDGILCNFTNPRLKSYIDGFSFEITCTSEEENNESNALYNKTANNTEKRFKFPSGKSGNDKANSNDDKILKEKNV